MQLLEAIVRDFGIDVKGRSKLALVNALNDFLINESHRDNNVLLIIDESQNLKAQQLEQIRLLSNLETEKSKLLQIVLVGQPELNRKLNLPELRQLQQRIMVRFHISPLEQEDTKKYILHRLNVAGAQDKITFAEETFQMIHKFSGGVPRLINIICDRALLAGYVSASNVIDEFLISKCIDEIDTNDYTRNLTQ